MATATNPQSPLPENWRERIANKWWGVKVAHEALQVANAQRRQGFVEHAIRSAYSVAAGKGVLPLSAGDDDMGVNVGDQTNYHSHGLSALGWLAVGASLLAGGAGGGIAAYELLKDDPPSAAVAPAVDTDTDTDTHFNFGIETR